MKKEIAKFTAFFLAAGFAFSQGSTLAAAAEASENTAVQTDAIGTNGFAQCSEYLNVRFSADQEGELVGLIPNNGIMEILDADENGWYLVRSGNVEGYVASQFVATGEKADEIAATAGYTTAEVGALSLNVRSEASDTSKIVGSVAEKEKIEVTDQAGDWIRVVLEDGTYGYVSHDYVYVSTEYRKGETLAEIQARLDAQAQHAAADSENSPQEAAASDATIGSNVSDGSSYAENSGNDSDSDTSYDSSYTEDGTDTSYDDSSSDGSGDDAGDDISYDDAYTEAGADSGDVSNSDTSYDDSYTDNSDGDSYTDNSGDDSYIDNSGDDSYTDNSGDDSYTDNSGDGSYTDDSYMDNSGDDSYTDNSGGDSYTDNSGDDSYTDNSGSSDGSGSSDTSSTGQTIADYACQFVGNPYVWGGSSLTNGADCSGFTMAVFSNFGISLPHNAASQSGYGTSVSADSLAPGDLVFYSDGGGISHVAIYIGGGQIVHAANSNSGIITSDMYYSTPACYRRVV